MEKSRRDIIEDNSRAVRSIVAGRGLIDTVAAELTVRNVAVAADRLTYDQFMQLDSSAAGAMLQAGIEAQKVAPLTDDQAAKLPTESDDEHFYRTRVLQPLHNLQSAVSTGEFTAEGPASVEKVKRAVQLGGVAFEKVVTDPVAADFPELQEAMRYFSGNAENASGRVERIAS
jgi:hypothetical protein